MSQHDYDITESDVTNGAQAMAAINAALQALASNNSGATEPTTKYHCMLWPDLTARKMKMWNEDESFWIELFSLDESLLGTIPVVIATGGTPVLPCYGFTAALEISWAASKVDNACTVEIASLSGTSNSNQFYATGIPAQYRPRHTKYFPVRVQDGGVWKNGLAIIGTDGIITFCPSVDGVATGWATSGTKAVSAFSFQYITAGVV